MKLIDKIKKLPAAAAFTAGLTIGAGGVYQISQDSYSDTAEVITSDHTESYIKSHIKNTKVNDKLRVIVFVNDKIEKEIVQTVTDVPRISFCVKVEAR